jgi:hypothetical protein
LLLHDTEDDIRVLRATVRSRLFRLLRRARIVRPALRNWRQHGSKVFESEANTRLPMRQVDFSHIDNLELRGAAILVSIC